MFDHWKAAIPNNFPAESRVWIYQSSRFFLMHEALEIADILNDFTTEWLSHGQKIKGYAGLLFGQFIVFMADETQTNVSGCSTDSSVRIVKNIEQRFKISMFDRTTLAFIINGKIQLLPMAQLQHAYEHQFVNADTIFFNNMVSTKRELLEKWLVPIKNSWLSEKLLQKTTG